MKKRMTAVLVLLCMLLCVRGAVFAAQSGPDLTRECSIKVHLKTFADEPVTDGSVKLVQVSELCEGEEGQYYRLNAGFGTLPFDPVEERFEEGTAPALEKIAVQNALPFTTAPFTDRGIATFTSLVPGLYLLFQTEDVLESYTAMPATLMLVPDPQEDGTLKYDADCYPKPVTTFPDESTTAPDESTTTPDESTTSPDESTTSPDESTTSPGESTTSPGESTTSPGESTTTPGESTTTPNTPPPDIPRTGQLWWPVAVLGVAGAALIVVGLISRRKEEA